MDYKYLNRFTCSPTIKDDSIKGEVKMTTYKRLGDITFEELYNNCVYTQHPEYDLEDGEPDRCSACSLSDVCSSLPEDLPNLNSKICIETSTGNKEIEEVDVAVI